MRGVEERSAKKSFPGGKTVHSKFFGGANANKDTAQILNFDPLEVGSSMSGNGVEIALGFGHCKGSKGHLLEFCVLEHYLRIAWGIAQAP
jgi:hypothetical protein